ncbi:DUF2269 domain-containing protein [Actinokineospora sp.]|uniref:DUF2269 domain-containing protein n=1 Tax=Actinokineospora sp. TaxID=1872133 RepID=UPI0040376AB9
MRPRLRKVALTAHVTTSVGWLGAVLCVLALAIAGRTSQDAQVVRAAYLAMDLTGWYVLVPLSIASLLTGLVQALGTTWGLFRHYWVLIKLLITVVATAILLVYTRTLGYLADTALDGSDPDALRTPSVVMHATAALLLLLAAATLSIVKPPGRTSYGQRKQHSRHTQPRR